MLKTLSNHPTTSLIVGTTVASMLSAGIFAIASNGVGALGQLISLLALPRILAAIAVIIAGGLLTFAAQRLARVAANVVTTPAGPAISAADLRLLKIAPEVVEVPEGRTAQQAMDDLDAMVGLRPVKGEVNTLIARLKLEERRRAEGMPVTAVSQHMVFTGPPGVGKTQVARSIGEIYRGLGVLKKGHLVEAERKNFIGTVIGETAKRTSEICERSLDGVLFIDEAYSLVVEGSTIDYGQEAISTLITYMENYRDRLIVIVAGYPRKMESFLESNAGLGSRFSKTINFPSYSRAELCEILFRMANSQSFILPEGFEQPVGEFYDAFKSHSRWGNARTMRNLLDKVREAQAVRLMQDASSGDISSFTFDDLTSAVALEQKQLARPT
ncbi:MAG: AAA family ATPase [Devosia sp.]